jgi:hypothetical protein
VAGVSANAICAWVDRGVLPTAQAVPNGKHLIRESDLADLLTPRRHGLTVSRLPASSARTAR